VLRTEDPGLLRGRNRYLDDLRPEGGRLHVVFARSEHAHAVLDAVHVEDALSSPGVVAVYTAESLGVAPHQGSVPIHPDFVRSPLAADRVRFVGEPIAAVVAASVTEAADAAALVWADYSPLPALIDPHDALADGVVEIFDGHGSNSAMALTDPPVAGFDGDGDDDADDDGDEWIVVRGRYVNQRMAVVAMEPNGCAAAWGDDGRLTFHASTQMPHGLADQLAGVLGIERSQVRVVTPQVGGGFGGKAGICAEYVVAATAARLLGRPVTWQAFRSEDLVSLPHSRAQVQYAELRCRRDGTFGALRVRLVGDAGAYPGIGAFLPVLTKRMANGTYRFDAIQFDVAVAVTNTTPTGAYRGAGRPEATALLERLVAQAALELAIDPIELRKRNLITDDAFPFATLTGVTYDSGAYATPLDVAAEAIGYEGLRADQRRRRQNGDRVQLGIGVATYVEITAGGDGSEFGAVEVLGDGTAVVRAGTQSHGQGHQTAFAMIVSDQTGIPVERIVLVDGDTDLVPTGGGTGGSRSLQVGGSAVRAATVSLVDRARELAASALEADPADVVVDRERGVFHVAGVPSIELSWADLAARAAAAGEALAAEETFRQSDATFPFGAHIAAVEVDLDTGHVRVLRHVAADDCGTVLNPLLVEGQQHGGIAAGIGQALFEQVSFDGDGNPLTANLADYNIATADVLPSFETRSPETPTPLNPLGAKGIGEAATIGSTPAVQNAVIDALAHLGVRHIDLPCTPQRVWAAVQAAESGAPVDPWQEPPDVFDRMRAAHVSDEVDEDALKAADI
jgi:carbon-monoxide dehydrogenase large subunit